MGIINIPGKTTCSVKAAPEAETLLPGRWSLVSHSSSVMGTLVSRAAARGFGFAKILGTGNDADPPRLFKLGTDVDYWDGES